MDNINGYVKHYATAPDQTYIYPVGSGSDLRFLAISGTIAAAGVYATVWIVGDPTTTMDPTTPNAGLHPVTSVAPGISIVSTSGQWDWQDVSGNAAGVTITVSIPDMTNFATASNLRLAGWGWPPMGGPKRYSYRQQ